MDSESIKQDLELMSDGEVNNKSKEEIVAFDLGSIEKEEEKKESKETKQKNVKEKTDELKVGVNLDSDGKLELVSYTCSSCGCKFSASSYYPISSCIFCGSVQITKVDNLNIDNLYMLPFVDTANDAKKDYKKKVLLNPLIPFVFKKSQTIKKIRKVYIPCMLYDIDVSGPISFTAADKIKNVKAAPVQAFETGFTTNFNFTNLANCSFSLISDEMFDSINTYNFSVLQEFNSNYLRDAFYFCHNEDKELNLTKIKDRITKYSTSIVRDNVNHQLKKVKKNSMSINVKKSCEVLVPMYILNVKYNNKIYTYVMNGQTGKSTIDVAFEKKNIVLFGLVLFIVIFSILTLLAIIF